MSIQAAKNFLGFLGMCGDEDSREQTRNTTNPDRLAEQAKALDFKHEFTKEELSVAIQELSQEKVVNDKNLLRKTSALMDWEGIAPPLVPPSPEVLGLKYLSKEIKGWALESNNNSL